METLITKDGKYVAVDGDKAIVFDKKVVEKEIIEIDAEIALIPKQASDDELLSWARLNYPEMDYSVKVQSLERRKEYLKILLEGIK